MARLPWQDNMKLVKRNTSGCIGIRTISDGERARFIEVIDGMDKIYSSTDIEKDEPEAIC